jgi:50S ribosomal protein L16 3-hydroxylase
MTYSIGFRSPNRADLAHEVLLRMADAAVDEEDSPIYRDPRQPAVSASGAIPQELQTFARDAVRRALEEPLALERALGEALTEPKPNVWFEPSASAGMMECVVLDRRTRMMYDARHVFINGESYRAAGRDATLMQRLADQRRLDARDLARASDAALELLSSWCEAGWVHASSPA